MATIEQANPVRVGLMLYLRRNLELKEFGPVFYRKAPQGSGTETPYCVISKAGGTPDWAFAGTPIKSEVYLVKGVGTSNDAEAIDKFVKTLLNPDTEFDIEGHKLMDLRWESDVDYEDDTDGERYQHVGAEYRIVTKEIES